MVFFIMFYVFYCSVYVLPIGVINDCLNLGLRSPYDRAIRQEPTS